MDAPKLSSPIRTGATVLLVVVVVLVVIWVIRGGTNRPRSATLAAPEPDPGGVVNDKSAHAAVVSPEDKRYLLGLARKTLEEVVRHGREPVVEAPDVSERLRQPSGAFVTLEKNGQLRGCIGHIQPREPLYRAVIDNAHSAAMRDTRFSPVTPEELASIEVEVSVLTVPQPLEFSSPEDLLNQLTPHQDGLVLTVGFRRSTFLPQVWEKLPDKVKFLQHLSTKAGLPPNGWRDPQAVVTTYRVIAFKESELAPTGRGKGEVLDRPEE
jgi:AmmeMemoRadiSam system protein A